MSALGEEVGLHGAMGDLHGHKGAKSLETFGISSSFQPSSNLVARSVRASFLVPPRAVRVERDTTA